MKLSNILSILIILIFTTPISASEKITIENPNGVKAKRFIGELYMPADSLSVPAVIMIHGSSGVDERYEFHRKAILSAGYATFEMDFKTGIYDSYKDADSREFRDAAFASLRTLRKHPNIDPSKILIMGFSFGGNLALQVASDNSVEEFNMGETGFAGHVGFYPSCDWIYDSKKSKKWDSLCEKVKDKCRFDGMPTGSPILILAPEKDAWKDGKSCPGLVEQFNRHSPDVAKLIMYPNVYHGFDNLAWKNTNPSTDKVKFNEEAALDSSIQLVEFLKSLL